MLDHEPLVDELKCFCLLCVFSNVFSNVFSSLTLTLKCCTSLSVNMECTPFGDTQEKYACYCW